MSNAATGYIHAFTPQEQQRLVEQARFLEAIVYPGVDFHGCARVLEVGCGVGAQLDILVRRFPGTRFIGLDASAAQLAQARILLAGPMAAQQVTLLEGSASLPRRVLMAFSSAGFSSIWQIRSAPCRRLRVF